MMTLDDDSPEARFLARLRLLDTAMVYPLLLEVFRPDCPEDDRRQILADLESYLVRRQLGVLTTKGYNRQFVDLVRRCEKDGFTPNVVRGFLLGREGDSAKWPTDDELKAFIHQQVVYKRVRNDVLQMVLDAVNGQIRDQFSERITVDQKLTIEHIMPQQWEQHWPLQVVDPALMAEAKERRQRAINTLGNLTLVTEKLNPSLSNSPWAKKREAIVRRSMLTLNRQLEECEVRDEAAIAQRADMLFQSIRKIWPRPSGQL